MLVALLTKLRNTFYWMCEIVRTRCTCAYIYSGIRIDGTHCCKFISNSDQLTSFGLGPCYVIIMVELIEPKFFLCERMRVSLNFLFASTQLLCVDVHNKLIIAWSYHIAFDCGHRCRHINGLFGILLVNCHTTVTTEYGVQYCIHWNWNGVACACVSRGSLVLIISTV